MVLYQMITVLVSLSQCQKINMAMPRKWKCIAALFCRVLSLNCLNVSCHWLITDDLQFGFKKHSSCSHAFYIPGISQIFCAGSKVFCVSLDASKAFDKVLHSGLMTKLINKDVPVVLFRLLYNWYKRLNCSVLWNNVLGDVFPVSYNVRQGGLLSPILFSVYVDDLQLDYGIYIDNFLQAVSYMQRIFCCYHLALMVYDSC